MVHRETQSLYRSRDRPGVRSETGVGLILRRGVFGAGQLALESGCILRSSTT